MNISRRNLFRFAFTASLQRLTRGDVLARVPSEKTALFANGKCVGVIQVSPRATGQVRAAAETFAEYFQLSTGSRIPIRRRDLQANLSQIHIGSTEYAERKVPRIEQLLDGDGFVIERPDSRNIVIRGSTDWGTEFGVYEFLERYLEIRWLFPGRAGEYVPRRHVVEISGENVRQNPAFFSRQLDGMSGDLQERWARRNRMHGQIEFHHNLLHLFPPKKYRRSHPHFFPIVRGQRYFPPHDKPHEWQPCFSAPGIVEEAVQNITLFFDEHPGVLSYSLGINDSGNFCECPTCTAQGGHRRNFLGFRDFSDLYFQWANAVVSKVVRLHPDKWFGCLAYREIGEPPSNNSIHLRIVPYLTYERLKWIDRTKATAGRRITRLWKEAAKAIGWYDYMYGTPYCLPRVYFDKMAENYRYAKRVGVRDMYAEAFPNWGEGPKLYISLRLQWEPFANVRLMVREWCEKAVGLEAAPYLEAYYDIWERFWTQTVVGSEWFLRRGQYLRFQDPVYIESITDEISESRRLLQLMLAETLNKKQRTRANIIFKAFTYYEASVISYFGSKKGRYQSGVQPDEILSANEAGRRYFTAMSRKRRFLTNEFAEDPILRHPLRFDRYPTLRW